MRLSVVCGTSDSDPLRKLRPWPAVILFSICWLSACDQAPRSPSMPSPLPSASTPAPSPPQAPVPLGARPIPVGDKITAVLDPNDRSCGDDGDGERYPCLWFLVTVPADGNLNAQLIWDNAAARLLLLIDDGWRFVNDVRRVSPLHVTMRAVAGGTYLIGVWNLTAYGSEPFNAEQFELTTALDPR